MRMTSRVRRLEQSEAFSGADSLTEQAFRLADRAAMRIAGMPARAAFIDEVAREAILADFGDSFLKKLSRAELSRLQVELRQRRDSLLATGTVR